MICHETPLLSNADGRRLRLEGAARFGMRAGVTVYGVEPETAACLTASLAAGEPTAVENPGTTMAGLDCAEVFDEPLRKGAAVLVHQCDRKGLELSLKGIPQYHQIQDRHQNAHDKDDRVPPELLEVPLYDREESDHAAEFFSSEKKGRGAAPLYAFSLFTFFIFPVSGERPPRRRSSPFLPPLP